jgi:putative endonuclease
MEKHYVYLLSSKARVLYVGQTNNLARRIYEHKSKLNIGFTAKYNVDSLVYYEEVDNETIAEQRERQIKGWRREKKINLIVSMNPGWNDLSSSWMDNLLGKEEKTEKKDL